MASAGDIVTPANLTELVEEILSPTWEDVTVNSPYSAEASPHAPQVCKIGNRVYMKGGIDNTSLSTSTNHTGVMSLPSSDYWPEKPIRGMIPSSSVNTFGRTVVGTDGEISLGTSSVGSQYLWDQISWAVS